MKTFSYFTAAAALVCAVCFVWFHAPDAMKTDAKADAVAESGAEIGETVEIDYNTWVAKHSFRASDAANWSAGMPKPDDNILLSSASKMDMVWDAGVNGLPGTVASWTQEKSYTGCVTINTARGAGFPVFTVTGDVVFAGGTWTHARNTGTSAYWLNVAVGGDFEFGADARIDADGMGIGAGGGAVCLEVAGEFAFNGRAVSKGRGWWGGGGGTPGGSVDISAGRFAPGSSGNASAAGGGDGRDGNGADGSVELRAAEGGIPAGITIRKKIPTPEGF